jgi:hypothetical protein
LDSYRNNGVFEGTTFDYYWIGADGLKHEGNQKTKGNEVEIEITGIASLVAFKPPKAYIIKPHIERVTIYGFELEKAGEFVQYAEQIESLRDKATKAIVNEQGKLEKFRHEVNALQAQRGTIQQDISTLKSSLARESTKVKRLESQRAELIAQTGEMERSLSSERSLLDGVKTELARTTKIRSELASRIVSKKHGLSELEANLDLFPSELSGFSKQGAHDFRSFLLLSLVPIALIVSMFAILIRGAADLTTRITGLENVNLGALAISRAPYVIISCTIITASYYLAKMLLLEMVRISRQRLALTKISIVAKDVSSSIDSDLNLSDDDRYNKRLLLKMDMMRDHLKEYVSSDFRPSLPANIAPSLAFLKNSRKSDPEPG